MKDSNFKALIGLAAAVIILSGCANYTITVPLEKRLDTDTTCRIGAISDKLPPDLTADEKPTVEDIAMFKNQLDAYLSELSYFEITEGADHSFRYIINGAIYDYNKGSGVGRFLFGSLTNSDARLGISLELIDAETGSVVFSGYFKSKVTDWSTSGDEVYNNCARDFAKALKKEMRKFD